MIILCTLQKFRQLLTMNDINYFGHPPKGYPLNTCWFCAQRAKNATTCDSKVKLIAVFNSKNSQRCKEFVNYTSASGNITFRTGENE